MKSWPASPSRRGRTRVQSRTARASGTFDGWTKTATDAWSKAGFTSTPTILVDGEKLEFSNDTDPAGRFSKRSMQLAAEPAQLG